jgi:hypothetical protein
MFSKEGHQTFWWPKLLSRAASFSAKDAAHNHNHRIAIGVFDLRQLKVAQRGGWQPGFWWNVFRGLGSGRRDDTYRRTFQPRCYGLAHAGTECVVHGKVGTVR